MPNRPGYGVYGYPRELDGSLASAPSAVHAVKPGATTYSPVTWVYQWCNDAWVLVWGATLAPPATVTATYIPAGTKARVTWTAPALNVATSWTVRRSDGSVVASGLPLATLTVDDDSPLQGSNVYTVEAVNGSSVSTRTASAPLTINLQPATATVAYAAVGGATISWTANAAQGAPDQWRVYNATTGQWASGLLSGATLSFTATGLSPDIAYTFGVYPHLAGVQGTGRNTAPLTINVQPATASATYQATNSATISWTPNAVYGNPSQWRVWNVTTGAWASAAVSGGATSTVVSGLTPGDVITFGVYPILSGVQGTGRNTNSISVPPTIPAGVSAWWAGTRYSIHLAWAYPGGVVSNYEIEGYDLAVGSWVALGTNASGAFDWGGMSGQGYFRIRSQAPGGVSGWVQVGPVTDTTGPPAPVPVLTVGPVYFEASWADHPDAQMANASTTLQASYGGGAWSDVFTTTNPAIVGTAHDSGLITVANRGASMAVRLVTSDVAGNVTYGTASASQPTKPLGTFTFLAAGCDYYTVGVGWRSGWFPYSDSAYPNNSIGAWFYASRITDFTSGLWVPDSASIFLVKQGSDPGEAGVHNLQLMVEGSWPSGPTLAGGALLGPNMSTEGQSSEWPIPYAMYYSLAVGSTRGMALVDSGGPRRLYGPNLNGNSGRITFTYT